MTSLVFVALDTPDIAHAKTIAEAVAGSVGGIKLGLEFFNANGPQGIAEMASVGLPIFLDLKLHDISNTVGKAMQSLAHLKPAVITVHAAGGRAMMAAAKEAAPEGTKVVGVTLLTSLDDRDMRDTGIIGEAQDHVTRLTELAREAGLDGVVCSGQEVAAAKALWPDGYFVVPGVRMPDGDKGDQKRIVTPAQAVQSGASMLVIGRPITQADNPAGAAQEIEATLQE